MKSGKLFLYILAFVVLFSLTTVSVSADIGPKASVTVTVNGVEEGVSYYATLLSESSTTGPAASYDGNYSRYEKDDEHYDIWKKFVEYQDNDGYYFLQEFWECSGTDEFRWGYFPPSQFKILLYFPEYDTFAVSGIYERYAFDTYYTVDLTGFDVRVNNITEGGQILSAEKSYDYTMELVSLVARIVITILLELAIALLFGLRQKKQLAFLAVCNVITQVVLNVCLNIVNYNKGQWAFTFYYVLWEILVFAIEAVAYSVVLSRGGKSKAVAYAFVANAVSFAVGLLLAHVIPGVF